jgi:hypothetical protein
MDQASRAEISQDMIFASVCGIMTQLPGVTVIGQKGQAPASVAMELAAGPDGFGVAILNGDGQRLLTLGPFAEEDVVAEWRALAAAAGLPLVMLFPNGSVLALYDQVGPVRVEPTRTADRRKVLNGRRPRFLTRRKTGRIGKRPRVFRETEIATGKGM